MSAAEDTRDGLPSDGAVAALLLTIDPDHAARVLRALVPDQLERVIQAMAALRGSGVRRDVLFGVLATAMHRLQGARVAIADVPARMEAVLARAFGEEAEGHGAIGHEIGAMNGDVSRFAVFEALAPRDLADLLAGEHPQIAAVFLAQLDPALAAAVVNGMPAARRPDVIYRIATLDRTPEDLVQTVLEVMTRKVADLGLTRDRKDERAWIKAAAEILNSLDDRDQTILRALDATSEDVARSIRDAMFTFEDIGQLDRRSVQRFLAETDTRTLAVALKATSLAVEENIMNNLSKRAADMVRDERDRVGPLRLSVVMEAQGRILGRIRSLIEQGAIESAGAVLEPLV